MDRKELVKLLGEHFKVKAGDFMKRINDMRIVTKDDFEGLVNEIGIKKIAGIRFDFLLELIL